MIFWNKLFLNAKLFKNAITSEIYRYFYCNNDQQIVTAIQKVYEVGFSSFCLKYGVIATKEDMPHRTTNSRDALDDIWHEMAHVFIRVTSETL
jgi:hypothetical protein